MNAKSTCRDGTHCKHYKTVLLRIALIDQGFNNDWRILKVSLVFS